MRRFPRIQLQEEADASHQAGKQIGERKAPRRPMRRTRPGNKMEHVKLHEGRCVTPGRETKWRSKSSTNSEEEEEEDEASLAALNRTSPRTLDTGLLHTNSPHELFHGTSTGTLLNGILLLDSPNGILDENFHRDSHTNSFTGLLPGLSERDSHTNKEKIFFLFLLRTLPHARRDSCPWQTYP